MIVKLEVGMTAVTVPVNNPPVVAEGVIVGLKVTLGTGEFVGGIGTGELVDVLVGIRVGIGEGVGVGVADPGFIFPGEGFSDIFQSAGWSLSKSIG